MRKMVLSILFLSVALGLNAAEIAQKNLNSKEELTQIKLYAENNDKKIIETLPATTQLIKIYQKGDWIKVGNPKDGTVGWINQKQYQKATKDLNRLNIQEIFIVHTPGKNDPSVESVVVYQNGQPVSEKEAKEFYQNVKKQLEAQQEYWNMFAQNMINSQNQMLADFFRDPFFIHTAGEPIPVMIMEKKDNTNNTDSKNQLYK